MKTKIITFWSPVKRQGGCSTNVALYASYLSQQSVMNETEKAVIYSINENADATDYLTSNSIKNGSNDLLFLSEMNNLQSKEDVLAYTHKLSENLDILGTGKDSEIITKSHIKIIEILATAYDYIIIDSVTDENSISLEVMGISDLIVVCVPQDRFVYEKFDMSIFENKKVIFLSAMHNEKNELSLNKIQSMIPVQAYKISRDDKINNAVYNQDVFNYVGNESKKKSTVINELRELHSEIHRLINIERLNITYEIKKSFESKNSVVSAEPEPEIKIIREYKFIKAKNNIAVLNLSQGAGSTFIALNLAYALKDNKVDVSVIEVPYENMSTKADIFNIIHDDKIVNRDKAVVKDSIKFYLAPQIGEKYNSKEDIIEYIGLISRESSVNIYDIGSQEISENLSFLLNVIDVAIIIVDPMPYKLLQAEKKMKSIKMLEEKNINTIYIINKHIKDLNLRDIEKYLDVRTSSCVPFISPETLYAAYYSNHVVYRLEKSETFRNSLHKVLTAANILEYKDKKERKKFKLFNWR